MSAQRDPYQAPAVRAFARALTSLRTSGKLSKIQLAEALGYTPQYVGQIEACKNIPSAKFAEDLDTYFQCGDLFAGQWELVNDTREEIGLPPGFTDYLEREAEATTLYIFEFYMIKGIFQTREYAYDVLAVNQTADEAERRTSRRMDRQKLLVRENPPQIVAVFDEMAIRRVIGGCAIMQPQIARLIEIAEMPNIVLQIVPAGKGSYAGLPGPFTILEFADAPRMVYTEGHTGGNLTDHAVTVWGHTVSFNFIRGAAMSADESLELLRTVWESL